MLKNEKFEYSYKGLNMIDEILNKHSVEWAAFPEFEHSDELYKPNYLTQTPEENLMDIIICPPNFEDYTDEQIISILKSCQNVADDVFSMCGLAKAIFDILNNINWTRVLIDKVEKLIESEDDLLLWFDAVSYTTKDLTMMIEYYNKAIDKLPLCLENTIKLYKEDNLDILNINGLSSKTSLARYISENFGDSKWGERILSECVNEAETITDFLDILSSCFGSIKTSNVIRKLIEEAKDVAKTFEHILRLFTFSYLYIKDDNLNKELLSLALENAETSSDFSKLAEFYYKKSDYELYRKMILKAFDLYKNKSDLGSIMIALALNFNDEISVRIIEHSEEEHSKIQIKFSHKEWAKNLLNKAETITKESITDNLEDILGFCIYNLFNYNWQKFKEYVIENAG